MKILEYGRFMAVGKPAFGAYSATYWDGVWSIDVDGKQTNKIK